MIHQFLNGVNWRAIDSKMRSESMPQCMRNTSVFAIILSEIYIKQSIKTVNRFYMLHKDEIALLNTNNLAKSFYNNSSKMVKKFATVVLC